MELRQKSIDKPMEYRNTVEKNILEQLSIPKEQWDEAKNWNIIRQLVSKKMGEVVVGRTTPIKKRETTIVSQEVYKMTLQPSLFRHSYPKHIKTDKQKLKYLEHLKRTSQISDNIFQDLVSVLKT